MISPRTAFEAISRDTEGSFCLAMTSYKDGDLAGFMIYPNGGVKMVFLDPRVTSLRQDEEVKMEMYFMDQNKNLDDGCGTLTFTTLDMNGKKVLISNRLERVALNDIARNKTWALFRNDKVIESYSLYGSALAVSQAMHCIGLNPNDPFLK